MKQSLYGQGDDELSLIVFNTEYLYIRRFEKGFIRGLLEDYRATNKQIETLKRDLLEDKIEIERYQNETKNKSI